MYIVVETNRDSCESIVVFASKDALEANKEFIEHIGKLTLKNDSAQFISKTVGHIFRRNNGWVSSSKDLAFVIQLITFEDPDDTQEE